MKKFTLALLSAASAVTFVLPAQANSGLLLQDLKDFSSNAQYSQGSDGHVIIDCWRQPWSNGEAIIATWRLRSYNRRPLLYVNGVIDFSESVVPFPLNGSPIGFSTVYDVASGSEELYLNEPTNPAVNVTASIGGAVEVGIERGAILPTTAQCPQ